MLLGYCVAVLCGPKGKIKGLRNGSQVWEQGQKMCYPTFLMLFILDGKVISGSR